jgi:hypothetical protein
VLEAGVQAKILEAALGLDARLTQPKGDFFQEDIPYRDRFRF